MNKSNSRIYNLLINASRKANLPPNGMHVYTDVRDLANAHILAVSLPKASNIRLIICAEQVSSEEISDCLRGNIGELQERTPEGANHGNKLDTNAYTCSSKDAKKVLEITFRNKEDTFVELARKLLEIKGREKA